MIVNIIMFIIIFIDIISMLIFEIMIFNVTVIIVLIVHYGNNNDNIDNFYDEENIDNYGDNDHNDFDIYLKYENYILIVNINIITVI